MYPEVFLYFYLLIGVIKDLVRIYNVLISLYIVSFCLGVIFS